MVAAQSWIWKSIKETEILYSGLGQ